MHRFITIKLRKLILYKYIYINNQKMIKCLLPSRWVSPCRGGEAYVQISNNPVVDLYNQENPKLELKTMNQMKEEINKNRVGIYAQKSAEVTAVGNGLASKEIKSPVTKTNDFKTNEKDLANTLRIKKGYEIQAEQEQHQDQDLHIVSDVEVVNSNHSSPISLVRGAERDKLNKATKLQAFPRCEEYYGKERWDKALKILKKIGYVNWEINTMFTALDKFTQKAPKRKSIEKEPPRKEMKKKVRLDNDSKEEYTAGAEVISGILLKEKYSTFDLRANIGDANHPNFHILPENRTKFYLEFYKFLRQDECFQDDPIVCSYFVNQTLMIECRNAQTLEQIDKKICRLDNRLWPGADFVMIPRSSERKNIKICIPYPYMVVTEILEIIKEQNRLPVEKWKVNSTEKWQDGICLNVEVDGGTYLRLIQDQDDIFFLMKRATIKLSSIDKSKNNGVEKVQDA